VLAECEHLAEGQDSFWVALQPDGLLCGFCWEAAQVLAGDVACSSCSRPAGDAGRDCVIVAKPVTGVVVHFWLCQACGDADVAEAEALG
jgi:predicted amidophosphoribosyltransferase